MREFLNNLSSLSWWLGVVVVGVVINILSPYISKGLEKVLIKTSARYRKRIAERSEKRRKRITELKANQHKQIMLAFGEQRLRIRSLENFFGGVIWFIFSGISAVLGLSVENSGAKLLLFVVSAVILLYGLSLFILAAKDSRKVIDVRNILNELNPGVDDIDIVDWL